MFSQRKYFSNYVKLLYNANKTRIERIFSTTSSQHTASEQFLNGTSAVYIDQIYNTWLKNPEAVHGSWDKYFRSNSDVQPSIASDLQGNTPLLKLLNTTGDSSITNEKNISDHMALQAIITSYQIRGHLAADIDPLGIMKPKKVKIGSKFHANTDVMRKAMIFGEKDMQRVFKLPTGTFIGGDKDSLTLEEILDRLEKVYCNKMGLEFMYITSSDQNTWIRQKFESDTWSMTNEDKRRLLKRLLRAHFFEAFLAKKYPSEKRFGLEGCEIMIPTLKQIIDVSTNHGIESFVMGMPHRGRLNVLANVCRKALNVMFTQFSSLESTNAGSGDVKYHLGTYIERLNRVTNKNIRLALVANPSHLESCNPVVQGKTRAEQFYRGDREGKKVLSILMHGDAAFCGQGVVYETMHLSDLPDYTTHGTIHIVVNNQIGFTTDPRRSRSSPYCTDVARVVNAPIFHVNADDPEAVMHVATVAAEFRAQFHKDVVVDLVCYRRNGHNEIDEPMFTQPLMYKRIKEIKPIFNQYAEKLMQEKITEKAELDFIIKKYVEIMDSSLEAAKKETHIKFTDWLDSPWSGFFEGRDPLKCGPTGICEETLLHIGKRFSSPPPHHTGFKIHKGLQRIFDNRKDMLEARTIDWAMGEAMAFGSLLKEGIHVRLSGQDVERGTFSHRHHVLHHQTIDKLTYCSMCHLYPDQASYSLCNSSLSECGVLAFEHGYSTANPNALVMWEGQFGDFANTAQSIIDTYISSGQGKWVRQSGIVMLLPHGMEGMGPEHSSSRVERYLQMSDDDPYFFPPINDDFVIKQLFHINWIVANCTTPANLVHIIRRQIALPFRKPLVLLTPKSLLRHPEARSSFDLLLECTEFLRVIPDESVASKNPKNVKKLIFCTGKIYYDLTSARKIRNQECDVAISRIEQICPFPFDLVKQEGEKYPNAEILWVQEEAKNQGAWTYVSPRLETSFFSSRDVSVVGRNYLASTSVGSKKVHDIELAEILECLFGPAPPPPKVEEKPVIKTDANKNPTKPPEKPVIKTDGSKNPPKPPEKKDSNKASPKNPKEPDPKKK